MATAQISPVIRHIHQVAGGELAHLSDSVLLDRFADQRDNDSFEILVRRHGGLVLGVCQRVLLDSHAAEDCFQAVFLVLASKARSLNRTESLGPWLHAVAVKVAQRARTRSAFRRTRERQAAVSIVELSSDAQDWRDVRPILDDAIARLPRKYRIPFILCHVQGRTVSAIARQLDLPRGTVATRLLRAREQLRSRLVRRGVTLSAVGLVAALSDRLANAYVRPSLVAETTQIIARNATLVSFASKYFVTAIHGVTRMSIAANLKTLTAIGLVAILGTCLLGFRCMSFGQDQKSNGIAAKTVSGANRAEFDEGDSGKSQTISRQANQGDWMETPCLLLRRKPILDYPIGPGDTLGIAVDGIFGDTKMYRPVGIAADAPRGYPVPVKDDGTIAMPRLAPLKVQGMTIAQVSNALEHAYTSDGTVPNEKYSAIVTLYRKRTIRVLVIRQDVGPIEQHAGGSRNRRGTGQQLELAYGENDLLTALAKSGGLPGWYSLDVVSIERAETKANSDRHGVQVIRPKKQIIWISMQMRPGGTPTFTEDDIILHNGDVVFVPAFPVNPQLFLPVY